MSAWRPIESAPKDGTWVLLSCDHGQYVAGWLTEGDGDTVNFSGWYVEDNKHGPYALRGAAPTHWMPLPAEPSR